jgi:probable phosphoglycerate mutase
MLSGGVVNVPVLLARHGETADNAAGLILGQRDPALSESGFEQAVRLARAAREARVVAVWTSPLQRARQTAAIVARGLGADAVVLEALIESDRGSWEGQSTARIARCWPDLFTAFEAGNPEFTFPGGESLRQQVQRTREGLAVVASGPSPALTVAHAGTIRGALIALGLPVPPERTIGHGVIVPVDWPNPPASSCRIAD